MAWSLFVAPAWTSWAGFALGLLTIALIVWVFRSLGLNVSETILTKRNHRLVVAGPYRWVRHPLYTAGISLFVSLALLQTSWLMLIAAAIAAAFVRLIVIPAEESSLLAKFEDQYRIYMEQTGQLLPRVSFPGGHTRFKDGI
jgi:protein-S-isoprenylcysteine O-methyltransferase Ste14